MKNTSNKTLWGSIIGGIASLFSLLAAGGASCLGICGPICAAPLASLFGLSVAGSSASPVWKGLQPILIAVSAVAFTVAFFSLYRNTNKLEGCTDTSCGCKGAGDKKHRQRLAKTIFWISLAAGICFIVYPIATEHLLIKEKLPSQDQIQPQCSQPTNPDMTESISGPGGLRCNKPCRNTQSSGALGAIKPNDTK